MEGTFRSWQFPCLDVSSLWFVHWSWKSQVINKNFTIRDLGLDPHTWNHHDFTIRLFCWNHLNGEEVMIQVIIFCVLCIFCILWFADPEGPWNIKQRFPTKISYGTFLDLPGKKHPFLQLIPTLVILQVLQLGTRPGASTAAGTALGSPRYRRPVHGDSPKPSNPGGPPWIGKLVMFQTHVLFKQMWWFYRLYTWLKQ